MFRAPLAHLQEALHKQQLVHYMSVISVGCTNLGSKQNKHVRNIPTVVCAAPPEDEQVVLETYRGC
jgi:hypothetical protein